MIPETHQILIFFFADVYINPFIFIYVDYEMFHDQFVILFACIFPLGIPFNHSYERFCDLEAFATFRIH